MVAFVVLAVIMIFVIPAFKDVFKSFGADLPAPTLVVIAHVEVLRQLLVADLRRHRRRHLLLHAVVEALGEDAEVHGPAAAASVPIFGDLVNKSSIARWTRTLSTMFAAGVPLVEALDSVGGASGNAVFAEATEKIQKDVSTGSALTTSMQTTGVFPIDGAADVRDRRGIGLARRTCSARPPSSTRTRSTRWSRACRA